MPTPTISPTDLAVTVGTPVRFGVDTSAAAGVTEVWVTEKDGGARIVQLPTQDPATDGRPVVDKVQWDKERGEDDTASFEIHRYARDGDDNYWLSHINQWTTDVQIVQDQKVVFWGPVTLRPTVLAAARVKIDAVGAGWRIGRKMMTPTDTQWSHNFIRNGSFTNGWSHWSPSSGPGAGVLDTVDFETGTQSVRLEPGDMLEQTIRLGFSENYDARLRARVKVDATISAAELRVDRDGLQQTIRGRVGISADTPRGQWVWLVIDVRVVNTGNLLPAEPTVTVDGIVGSGYVRVDRVEWQVRPESLGLPGRPRPVAGWLSPSLAAAHIVATCGADLNMSVLTDPTNDGPDLYPEWISTPMRGSEALRAIVEQSGQEQRWLYSATTRVLEAKTLIGTEYAPSDLTFRLAGGEGAGTSGNVVGLAGDGGIPNPVTRVIARSEDGFTDTAEDTSQLDGMVFEQLEQVPVGVTRLGEWAQAKLRASNDEVTVYPLGVTDRSLLSTIDIGDRVRLVANDGPDTIDRLVRVEKLTATPGEAVPLQLVCAPWVEPDEGLKVPRGAKATTWQNVSDEVTFHGRRLNDVERRLTDARGVERFDELLDVAAKDDDAPDDGDVPVWDSTRERWVPGAAAGGSGAYSSACAVGTWTAGVFSAYGMRWSQRSDEALAIEAAVYDDGLLVTARGNYHVSVVAATASGSAEVEVRVVVDSFNGWRWDGEVNTCRPFAQPQDQGAGVAAASLDLMLHAGAALRVECSASEVVYWVLTVHWLHDAPVAAGNCQS